MSLHYEYSIGETIKIYLDAIEGDVSIVAEIEAQLRKAGVGVRVADPDAPLVATFDISSRAATEDNPAGWDMIIDSDTSETLTPGMYLTDAKLTLTNGEIVKTSTLSINIVPAVTRP
jgi:hypothetical protein